MRDRPSPLTTLAAATDVAERLSDDDCVVVDCRFVLSDPTAGRRQYEQGHVPGAVYAHLDDDLSDPVVEGTTGRHPLPEVTRFAATVGGWGIDAASQVVVYDASGGAIAARLWWMLRWVGHDAVAVLDGGWPAWERVGAPVATGYERSRARRAFVPQVRSEMVVSAADVDRHRTDPAWRVLDARAADRYRGENETLDPVAGHIPGARSVPFADNLDPDGTFRSPEALRERFAGFDPAQTICYCGSGVTAAHNLLAMELAGCAGGRLYAGSWSEWITDPARAVASGDRRGA